jgi:uncharacterized RDD family membrane protein YckC
MAAKARRRPASMRRSFVTPEGVDLALELGPAGTRATAFLIDALLMLAILVVVTLALIFTARPDRFEFVGIVWLLGFFLLRKGWFTLFEMGSRGATPGKRMMGLRVVARDGARLTGGAVVARNAMREIEVFLPLSFLAQQSAEGTADTFLTIFSLLWSGIFLFFPLFTRDRLRVGDLVAGTWVIQVDRAALKEDLAAGAQPARHVFPEEALRGYGIFELQMLEQVLRHEQPAGIATVAHTIRRKFGLADDHDDYGFLFDFYGALCARLESRMILGDRRESKAEA